MKLKPCHLLGLIGILSAWKMLFGPPTGVLTALFPHSTLETWPLIDKTRFFWVLSWLLNQLLATINESMFSFYLEMPL